VSDAKRLDNAATDGPGGGKSRRLPLVLVAVGVALLLVVGVTVAALTAGRDKNPAAANGAGSTAAEKPSAAVRGYLEAVAARDAERAIGYLETAPADKTFLTRKVLAASAKRAPLTAIDVPEVSGDQTSWVTARYNVGKQAVTEDYSVTESDGRWKIVRGLTELNLGNRRDQPLPLLINGVELTTDTAALFPGHYSFTTSSKWVSYGSGATVVLTDPSNPISPRLTPMLTPDAEAAFLSATKKALSSCLAQRKLAPPGCPNRLEARRNQKVDEKTIRWTLTNDPFADARVTVDPSDLTVAEAVLRPRYHFKAKGTQDGRRATFDGPPSGLGAVRSTGDLSKDVIRVELSTA
jgi:hypothetical protein